MTITPDQLFSQIQGTIQVLEKIPAKERGEAPHKEFGENYNNLLSLAKEVMPHADARRWPPAVQIHTPAMGQLSTVARYVEIHAYLKQIQAILAEGMEPPAWGAVG